MSSTREWSIKRANDADAEAMYAFLEKAFFHQEPVTKRFFQDFGVPPPDNCLSIRALKQGLSFKAVLPSGQIVGAALCLIKEDLDMSNFTPVKSMQSVIPFFEFVDERSEGDEEGWLTIQVLSVDPGWRRQGIAERLVDFCVDESSRRDLKGVRVMCTSAFTARLFAKRGWEMVYNLPYEEYRTSEGEELFQTDPPHDEVAVYLIRRR